MKVKKIFLEGIVVFFTVIICNGQTYTDQEIGLDSMRIVNKLNQKGIAPKDFAEIIIDQRIGLTYNHVEYLAYRNSYDEQYSTQQSQTQPCNVPQSEIDALWDLYNSTVGSNWVNTIANEQPWDINTPVCDWFGVTVNNDHVVSLDLNNNNLIGSIPLSISQLTNLTYLRFDFNGINGEIPSTIVDLIDLDYLSIRANNLTGEIPTNIGNLVNLKFLDLAANRDLSDPNSVGISGGIPSSITSLINLEHLGLNYNSLYDIIPPNIGDLINLEYLSLSLNSIYGSIPSSIGNLTHLETCLLDGNDIGGEIPVNFWNLQSITSITISSNDINDSLDGIQQLSTLINFQANINDLYDDIPTNLSQLQNLKIFHAGTNNLSGSIPDFSLNPSLESIVLTSNSMGGTIPYSFINLTSLKHFRISYNSFEGIFPPLPNNILSTLHFHENKFIFSDFENEHDDYLLNASSYQFSPQAKVDSEITITVEEGQPIVFTTILHSPNNSYNWYKNDNLWVENHDNEIYTLPSAAITDEGTYYFKATNSTVQGLTLERHPIHVVVEPAGSGGTNTGTGDCNCVSFNPKQGKRYIISTWVKEDNPASNPTTPEELLEAQPISYNNQLVEITFFGEDNVQIGSPFQFNTTGEIIDGWQRIVGDFVVPETAVHISVDLINNNDDSNIVSYFDDVRIHPFNGSMKSFVYDNENYRLMAELDENNFATYYEYDNEGGLIRVKKETERGVMTIQETRSGNVINNN